MAGLKAEPCPEEAGGEDTLSEQEGRRVADEPPLIAVTGDGVGATFENDTQRKNFAITAGAFGTRCFVAIQPNSHGTKW